MNAADIEAIKRLKARYFRLMDTKQWGDFATMFAEDAVMDMSGELERNGVDGTAGAEKAAFQGVAFAMQSCIYC